jgi:D-methionine transport system ATP-binding protein
VSSKSRSALAVGPPASADAVEDMIVFDDVSKVFEGRGDEVHALRNVDLAVRRGDIFGVVGYSGAGKSTLLRTINGLELPTSGRVVVDGKDIASLNGRELGAIRQRIGMIFQQFNLLQSRNVFGNVAYPLKLAGLPKSEIRERVNGLLEFVGLAGKAKAYPEQLSGGQKQRVGIARALANRPAVLISDEATSALDPQTTGEVLALLKRVNREYGVTILLITHEMDVIRKICDRVAVMEDGRVVEHGNVYDVFADPREQVSQRFVSSVLHHHPGREAVEHIRKVHRGRLVEIHVEDRESSEPFLSRIARERGVDFNIVFGGVNELQSRIFGALTLELLGPPAQVDLAVADLRDIGRTREVEDIGNH